MCFFCIIYYKNFLAMGRKYVNRILSTHIVITILSCIKQSYWDSLLHCLFLFRPNYEAQIK